MFQFLQSMTCMGISLKKIIGCCIIKIDPLLESQNILYIDLRHFFVTYGIQYQQWKKKRFVTNTTSTEVILMSKK